MKTIVHWSLMFLALAALAPACRDVGDDELRNPPTTAALPAPVAHTTTPAAAAPAVAPPASGPATILAPVPRALAPSAPPVATTTIATTAAPSSGTVATPPASGGSPPSPSRPPVPPLVVLGIDVTPCDAAEGEDGRGNTVPAVHPVTLDVRAEAWPGRALDPVLEIGDLHFHHYRIPVPGTLRYTAADAAALPEGAQVSIRWRDDGRDRVLVTRSLQVPR